MDKCIKDKDLCHMLFFTRKTAYNQKSNSSANLSLAIFFTRDPIKTAIVAEIESIV